MAKKPDQDWDDLRYVLAVARGQTFATAARQLGINESTVARRIARAERRLRARLFERSQGRLWPTEAGAELVRRAESIERDVQAAEGALSGADERAAGTVRVTSVPLMVNHVLAPALPGLLEAHPGLRIELIAEPRDLSLTRREADIALRLARPHGEARAIARRVGRLDYAAYGPAEGIAGGGAGLLPWITYDDSMRDLPQARWMAEAMARESAAAPPPVAVNDAETILHCIRAGLGKSLLPAAVGGRQPGLARLDDGPPGPSRELWLMVHPELKDLIRIRVVMDWLTAALDRFLPPAGDTG